MKNKVKMGALLSFFAGLTSWLLGKMMGVRRINSDADLRQRIAETAGEPDPEQSAAPVG